LNLFTEVNGIYQFFPFEIFIGFCFLYYLIFNKGAANLINHAYEVSPIVYR